MAEKRIQNGGRDPGNGQFTAGNTGGGRKPMDPKVKAMLLAATPAAAQVLVDALGAEKSIVVGGSIGAYVEMVPDIDMRVKAANAIFDRVHGKPTSLVAGEDGGPAVVAVDLASMLRRLVK